jgi:RHS repeat-associated protein
VNRAKDFLQSFTSFAAILLILVFAVVAAHGQQEQQYTQNKSDQTLRSDIRVDPATHALGIQIPLASYPGRAGNKMPVTLYYSSKLWRIEFDDIYPPPSGSGVPRAQSEARYAEQSVAGWTSSLDVPTIEFTFNRQSYDLTSTNYGQDGGPLGWRGFIARIHVHLPDGSTHELRKDDAPHDWDSETNYGYTGTYYSVDGSRMRFDFDPGVRSGVLFMPDGGRYTFPDSQGLPAKANQYTDRNGNTLTYNSTTKQWTDSVGRSLGVPLPSAVGLTPGDIQYSVPGMASSSLTYTFKWRYLSDPTTGETVLSNPDPDPNNRLYYPGSHKCTWPAQSLTPRMFANAGTSIICASTKFNKVVLAEIVLPNNTSYRFRYNPYGEIDTIYLPSGGYERFQYNKIPPLTYLKAPYDQGNRAVTDRWLSSDGTAASEIHWQYGIEYTVLTTGPYITTCTHPDGTIDKLYLHAHPNNYGSVYKSVPFGMDDARTGSAYEERVYSSAGTLLRRKLIDWAVSPSTVTSGPGPYGNRNPRIAKEVEILFDSVTGQALAKTITREYDTSNQFTTAANESAVNDFDFVTMDQSSASTLPIESFATGTALRRTEKSFLETTNQAYRDRNLLGLVSSLVVRDMTRNLPAGVVVAQSSNSYDETGLLPCGATNWIDPNTPIRGNLTSTSRWLNFNGSTFSTFPSGSYITTRQQYDQCGSVRIATDANGNQSSISYSSAFNYAYPTTTTTAVPDATGGHSLNQSLTTLTDYDSNTGLVVSTTNANNQLTTMVYNDPLYRLTQVTKPDGAHVTYSYSDTPGDLYVRVLTDLDTSRSTETRQYFDGLGRATRKFVYQGQASTPWTVTDTYYDNMGRASKVSTPYNTATASGVVPATCSTCVVSAYDALGRVVTVTTSDGAHVDTAYNGSRVLITDQAGKQRINQTDALGRTTDIWEITAADQWTESVSFPNHSEVVTGYRTHYNYDQLDNLVEVVQSSQPHRFFLYDSLKRLVRSRIPEQGTYGSDVTDPITGNSAWSLKYVYDGNGNLTQRTEPRGIVSTYSYDALSRNTQVSYSNGTPRIDRYYDRATNGKGSLWYETTSNPTTNALLDHREFVSYDVMGRPLTLRQVIANNAVNYEYRTQRTYNQAGLVNSQTYPSGHVVTYNYDVAGRTSSFTGNLGDGGSRTYANNIEYSPFGGLSREQFGTNTPVYNKLHYNVRGQLCDVRASNTSDEWGGELGALVNYYSTAWAHCGSGTDNNGNVLMSQTIINSYYMEDRYGYDSLNRLTAVNEWQNGATNTASQQYSYDRWGNRTINTALTWGTGINNKSFSVDTSTNRLGVANGQTGTMSYDAAGNLINDTYTGAGAREYDAENKMTRAWGGNSQWQEYTYNAAGQRTRRKVDGQETWQVYGIDGEIVAEYAANGSASSPQKEYGYRNGQLLITAESGSASSSGTVAQSAVNVAAASNGAVATASSTYSTAAPSNANNGDHVGTASWWADDTSLTYPDWIQVQFAASRTISEIDVFGLQQNYASPVEPTLTMTSSYALTNFEVQYWNGSTWATVPGGSVSGNDKVWRRFSFAPLTTSTIRVNVTNVAGDNRSQVTEIEAYGPANLASSANGAVATASSTFSGTAASNANNGDHVGTASWWADDTSVTYPDWIQVEFAGSRTIGEIDVFGLQQNHSSPVEPTLTMTSSYALTNFEVQYWNGSTWATVPGGNVSGNDKVWNRFTFAPLTTSKIRVNVTNVAGDNRSQVVEIEAYEGASTATSIQWLVADHLGTPRMVVDQTGTLNGVKRHDYLPFGEELFAGVGGRTTSLGYSGGDGVRQQFTAKERDVETSLDYFGARYYSSTQGRFAGPDSLLASGKPAHPQSWNRYTYCLNHPLILVDPNGLIWGFYTDADGKGHYHWFNSQAELEAAGASVVTTFIYKSAYGTWVTLNPNAKEYVQNITRFDATRALWGYNGLEASWQDWVPVWGQFRRLMFNYATGNYEGALINFSMASVDGGTMAAGFVNGAARQAVTEGGEQAVLRFSQTTASPFFSEEGTFAGKTIGQLAQELRSGAISPKDIPIHVVDGADGVKLIVNTRSSLALTRAGIPQSSWNIIDISANQAARANIGERLFRNGLGNQGTDVLRITRSEVGKRASSLQ